MPTTLLYMTSTFGKNRTTRRVLGAICGPVSASLLSYVSFRLHFNLSTSGFIDLLAVVTIALSFGFWEATSTSVVAVACLDYFFAPPIFSFHVDDPQNWVALATFELTALIVSRLSTRVQSHMRREARYRRNAERLYELSRGMLLLDPRHTPGSLVAQLIKETIGLTAVVIFDSAGPALYTVGASTEADRELARNTYIANCNANDVESHTWQRVLKSGPSETGAIVLSGAGMTSLMADAIASLAATALERTRAFEKESRAEAARQSEQLRTTVLDALAHAFKTPLTVILSSSSGLMELGNLNPVEAALVQLIDQNANELNVMTTHLLRMAKLESSEIKLRRENVPISELVDEILVDCGELLGLHSVQVRIPDETLSVFADPKLLATTITELVTNAAKYSSAGSPIIISAQQQEERVVIAVHNDGSIIRPEERELIFERFYRSPVTAHGASGSGIGLSVVKKAAEAHRGKIWVDSGKDIGTTFFLSLPLVRGEHDHATK